MKVSVVIPTYNRREMVLEAVESVKRQTRSAHEIIVSVDGSTDGTPDAVRQRFGSDPRVIVVGGVNRGISTARNRGIAVASGEWIALLDDDDAWHPRKLEITATYFQTHQECRAITAANWYFTAEEEGPQCRLGIRPDFAARSLDECILEADRRGVNVGVAAISPTAVSASFCEYLRRDQAGMSSSAVVRRDILLRAGCFSPSQTCNEDWTTFLNVARLCEWHALPQRLTFVRFHPLQSTSHPPVEMLFSLSNLINAWMTGRPLGRRATPAENIAALKSYGPVYRRMVRNFQWEAVKRGHIGLFLQIRAAGRLLLPSAGDRLLSDVPPPIVWRMRRLIRLPVA